MSQDDRTPSAAKSPVAGEPGGAATSPGSATAAYNDGLPLSRRRAPKAAGHPSSGAGPAQAAPELPATTHAGNGGGTTAAYPLLTTQDVSHDKLRELLDRLLACTRAGKIAWQEHHDGSLDIAVPSGVVDVSERGVKIYDDRGREIRRFHPGADELFEAARDWFDGMRRDVLDRLLAELEAS